jgi:hypothetical protein
VKTAVLYIGLTLAVCGLVAFARWFRRRERQRRDWLAFCARIERENAHCRDREFKKPLP